jgi:hypothetical protein
MSTVDDIRRWAMALPEVEESSHFRFHVPVYKVRGRTFLGIGAEEQSAVFCISEPDANKAAAANPTSCEAVRRQDAKRSFLGLQVRFGSITHERIKCLVEDAWRQQAPKRQVAEHDRHIRDTAYTGINSVSEGGLEPPRPVKGTSTSS